MSWRVAKSLDVLLRQINEKFPDRDKSSDGSLGDAAHASRSSDHNPWVHDHSGQPVVTARDFTNDPKHMDSHELALALVAGRDDRIKYVIDHGRICSGTGQDHPAWQWRAYSGVNQHDHHVHVSVKDKESLYDDERPWVIEMREPTTEELVAREKMPESKSYQTLRKGSRGSDVQELQRRLNAKGATLKVDGDFGDLTRNAVINFQLRERLVPDGVVGKYTWLRLEG